MSTWPIPAEYRSIPTGHLPSFEGYVWPQTRFIYPHYFQANPAESEIAVIRNNPDNKSVSNKRTCPKPSRPVSPARLDNETNCLNAELIEEIKQLRAALMMYQEIARRAAAAQSFTVSAGETWN